MIERVAMSDRATSERASSDRANRHPVSRYQASFSLGNKLVRVIWGTTWLLLGRFSPPPMWGWRRLLLRAFGARIGRGARVYGSTRIWLPGNLTLGNGALIGRRVNLYNQGTIRIGRHSVISQDASLCASSHDVEHPGFPLVTRPIAIGDNVWIAAEAFVGPGVTIGDGAVLGARGVAMRPLEPWIYYSGNPATRLRDRPRLR